MWVRFSSQFFMQNNSYSRDILPDSGIAGAFKRAKRGWFLPESQKIFADIEAPIMIGCGQTNSQPATVAFMLERLNPKKGDKALDIGCGSGWTTALLSELVGIDGSVYGLEIIPELCEQAKINLDKHGYILKGNVQIYCTDAKNGLKEHSPFDVILVSAAASKVPPELLRELKIGGRMIIPVGNQGMSQTLFLITKVAENDFLTRKYPGFVFVPFV
jgi:protein-L-isoaspartate(D-aspartate) O-methyltransferase